MTRNYVFFLLPLMGDSFSNILCTSLYIYWVIEIELDTKKRKGAHFVVFVLGVVHNT